MGKIRRGGYVFITWAGDHDPKHVHVFNEGKEILKWNLEAQAEMKGKATKKIKKLIAELVSDERL